MIMYRYTGAEAGCSLYICICISLPPSTEFSSLAGGIGFGCIVQEISV